MKKKADSHKLVSSGSKANKSLRSSSVIQAFRERLQKATKEDFAEYDRVKREAREKATARYLD